MRLKEIKPGMVIHCKTEEESNDFLHFLHGKGFKWNGGKDLLSSNHFLDYREMTCYKVYEREYLTVGSFGWFADRNETVIEFSDLIIPELSAKEALETMKEICEKTNDCTDCVLRGNCDPTCSDDGAEKIIDICTKWREEHPKGEKKELETEWVYVVRIIKVHDNGKKECVHEVDLTKNEQTGEYPFVEDFVMEQLKKYCSEHKGNFFAVYENICRIKE